MVALYDYAAEGPEDLEFSEGDTIDILGEGEALNGLSFVFVRHFDLKRPQPASSPVQKRLSLPRYVSLPHSLVVNEEWLEGHCAGSIGIFPSCFAYRENANITQSLEL